MTKLALFSLTIIAIIAFSAVSAYKTTIVTTTISNTHGCIMDGLDNACGGPPYDGLDNAWPPPFDGLDNTFPPRFDGLDNTYPIIFDKLAVRPFQHHQGQHLHNPTSSQQCESQIPMEQLNQCKMHLTQGIIFDNTYPIIFDKLAVRPFQRHQGQHLQQCCSQLKQVREQCQCAAIQQAFNKAWQQKGGLEKVSEIASKAYKLPNDCGLEVQDCPLKVPRV